LIQLFPSEKVAIEKYFKDVKKVASHFGKNMMLKSAPPFLDSFLNLFESKDNIQTTKDYMNAHFKDEKLKSLLVSQWGDYGLPPAMSSFGIHALIAEHYMGGGYYPVGGAGRIAESIEPIISEKGGEFLLSHEVTEILCKDGKAVGFKVKNLHTREENHTKEFYSPVVISDAGAYNTYMKLIPKSVPISFRSDLEKIMQAQPTLSCVTLYIGFSDDPRKLGFKGENYWMYSDYDHDRNFENRKTWMESGEVSGLYLSFPSLKDPEAKAHTAEIIAFSDYEPFAKWKDQPWKKRDDDYKKLKEKISLSLIDYVEKRFPGFKNLIEYTELSTPLSNEYFTGHHNGNIYGLPCVPERFQKGKAPWCSVRTPRDGLYRVGADASSPGVTGAMMGGMACALMLMDGINIIRLFAGKGD
ncbi:MAG: NAD(P)/FAD-dependent oxidoreductase, partial [Leptospiraceae bacterium]|nr:NAD(P)/FAD-dependent oxidoreductase [Leptospiraceae bacterium]